MRGSIFPDDRNITVYAAMDECERPLVIVQTWHGARVQHYAVLQHHAARLLHCSAQLATAS